MPSRDIKKLEKVWEETYQKLEARRARDVRTASAKQIKQFKKAPDGKTLGAYLTPDILARRQELTLGGRQKLVLEFGSRDSKNHKFLEYTLKELNQMAAALDRRESKVQAGIVGVPIAEILKRVDKTDKQRAKNIAAATLYRFQGNTLAFRVTASGESDGAPSHYQVQIRLEGWQAATRMEGQQYLNKARHAIHGNVSIDCNCGRYLYWFRYLATVGKFAISPENVFPKIRNSKLRGSCCKHILKALSTLQSPVVQQRIAREMQNQAQSHMPVDDATKYLRAEQVKRMDDAGAEHMGRALRDFKKANKAFQEKAAEKAAQEAYKNLKPKKGKDRLKEKKTMEWSDKERELLVVRLRDIKAFAKGVNLPFETLVAQSAKNNPGAGTKEDLMRFAKEEGLL